MNYADRKAESALFSALTVNKAAMRRTVQELCEGGADTAEIGKVLWELDRPGIDEHEVMRLMREGAKAVERAIRQLSERAISDDLEQLAELTARADKLGFRVIHDQTWGYVLGHLDRTPTNPATHSNTDLNELREMLDGIEWGRAQGTAET